MFTYQNKMIRGPWVDANGTQYPAGWVEGATPGQLAEIGVVAADDIPVPEHDPATHQPVQNDDGTWALIELPPAPLPVVSPRQIRQALTRINLRAQVEAAVTAGSQDLKDWWEYSTEFRRDNPLVEGMAQGLGVTSGQVDDLWRLAGTL